MKYRFYPKDTKFSALLDFIIKIQDNAGVEEKCKEITDYVISNRNPMLAWRLAYELDYRNMQTTRLEDFIIDSQDVHYMYMFAQEIKSANIEKLQAAVVKFGTILDITRFGCYIKNADKSSIQDLIVDSNNAKCAYHYLKFVKSCDANKLKPIILKSKKPRYLYALAKRTSDPKEIIIIEDLILAANSYMYMRLFAMHIEGANISKIENRIIASKDIYQMRLFAKYVKSPRLNKICSLF